jgi:hypothetical protein
MHLKSNRIRVGFLFAVMAFGLLSVLAPGTSRAENRTGVGVSFGGVGSPFGEAVKGAPDTRHRRHFVFGGQFYHLIATGLGGDNAHLGGRLAFAHLSNDIRSGGTKVMTLAQFPITLMLAYTKGFGDYTFGVHAGGGMNINSVGKSDALIDLERENAPLLITIESDLAPVLELGLMMEYALSKSTRIVLESNGYFGTISTSWKFTGSSVPMGLQYIDSDIYVRHLTLMLGINIDLGPSTEG